MNLAEKLKYLRNKTGHAQVQIAELIGITPQYYYQLESGHKTPGEVATNKIASYYGVSSELLTNPAATEAELKPPNIEQKEQEPITPPAVKSFLYRMSDGSLCTAEKCEWRQRVDENTYYCPAGCMKELDSNKG